MSNDRKISRRKLLKMGAGAGVLGLIGSELGDLSALAGDGSGQAGAGSDADDALPQVPRRVLGKTGKDIPILLVGGAVSLDRRFDPKLAEALRFGVDYIDAADCYSGGACELAVASFVDKATDRDKIWITSKSDQHDPAGFEKTLHTSLEKLQTDYVDMYYLHALKSDTYLNDELLSVVERLKKEGKILHFGFSCHDDTVAELLQRAAELSWVDSVMFRYNFRQYGDTKLNRAIDACAKTNVGLIAMKTQGSEASFRDAWKKFEQTGKWNKHQAVLKAVWADDRITAAVSHMDSLEKLKQNIAAALDRSDLGQAEWDALERYASDTRSQACDGCDHFCNAAVDGPVQIGATMRYLMYHDVYGEQERARQLFAKLPAEARNLSRTDFSRASAACPHGIDVALHMRRAGEVLAG